MSEKIPQFTEMQLSALQEIGNIGSGHAALALSQLLGKRIMVAVPSIKVGLLEDLIGMKDIKSEDTGQQTVLFLQVLGEAQGGILFILEKQSTLNLASVLLNHSVKELTDIDRSAIMEVGNILSGSYLNALSEFLNLNLIPSVPHLVSTTTSHPLQEEYKKCCNKMCITLGIETEFIEAQTRVRGFFLFMPDDKGLQCLLARLKVA